MEEKLGQEPTDLIKIVLFGPESTGKTTLAKQLAEHYKTVWVPEYAREYLQKKWDATQEICTLDDLLPIAKGQMQLENQLAKKAKHLLFCDTDLLETKVYSEAYFDGYSDPKLQYHALKNTYDLYFLTDIDVPWQPDDLRDRPDQREHMFHLFKTALTNYGRSFILLKGSEEQRFLTAKHHINKLLTRLNTMDLSPKDLAQLKEKKIATTKVQQQIKTFSQGIPFVELQSAAVVGSGIVRVDDAQTLIAHYENNIDGKTLLKFVPASGAASRMFKALFNFIDAYNPEKETLEAYLNRTSDNAMRDFLSGIEKFPFYGDVMQKMEGNPTDEGHKAHAFVKLLLAEDGLNYGFYPKGLLPFHTCKHGGATPFKAHLKEAALYAKTNGKAHLHFTISPQHKDLFKKEEGISVPRISQKTDTEFNISYSFQKPATDTLAVTMDNAPFRNTDGSLLFRPGGHGALIENLNEQDADVIFIKNIDNVVIDDNLQAVGNSKKMLGGLLLQLQEQAFAHIGQLEEKTTKALINTIVQFATTQLNIILPDDFKTLNDQEKGAFLKECLDRPIRVCGMVKNEGEPGGGPFFIKDANGRISLQIIESAQIDTNDAPQLSILKKATHFNPVDLVCGVRNHKGEKFDLMQFVDRKQGFITEKTKDGKALKALELPGLWNGAMAFWNTVFVEVPLVTFNPVKTVNDLLKPSHQA